MANSAYENERQKARRNGDWNGVVPAAKARAHLLKLAKQGVGRRSVGAATDIADSILFGIRNGTRKNIRARTERKILAVSRQQIADHALVDAAPVWKMIAELIEEGFTVSFLARRLGYANPALQFGRHVVLAGTAYRVERLYGDLMT